jgi:LysM repeat protein
LCENLEACNKAIIIYGRKNNWATVMGRGVTEFSRYPLWEARYYFKSGHRPDEAPDIDWKWAAFGGWKQRAILQYAGTAPVKNWSADWNVVDLDRLGLDAPVPKPEPEQPEEDTMSSAEFEEVKGLIETERQARIEEDKDLAARCKRLETATSTAPKAPKRGESKYTVKAGDTLSKIAMDLLGQAGRFREIATLNRIKDANKIFVGQELRIPPR